jgi:hypothetical protein
MFLDFITLCFVYVVRIRQVWIRKRVMEAPCISKEGKDWLYMLPKT